MASKEGDGLSQRHNRLLPRAARIRSETEHMPGAGAQRIRLHRLSRCGVCAARCTPAAASSLSRACILTNSRNCCYGSCISAEDMAGGPAKLQNNLELSVCKMQDKTSLIRIRYAGR